MKIKSQIERIGTPNSFFSVQGSDFGARFTKPVVTKNHMDAMTAFLDWLKENENQYGLVAVGHRIVHGGPNLHEPQRLTTGLVPMTVCRREMAKHDPVIQGEARLYREPARCNARYSLDFNDLT